jgi:hypothetical protein
MRNACFHVSVGEALEVPNDGLITRGSALNRERLPKGRHKSAKRTSLVTGAVVAVTVVLSAPVAAQAEGANFVPQFGCAGVTISLAGFPNKPGNTVTELIQIDRATTITKVFTFDGPSATDTIPYELTVGHHQLDARVKWSSTLGRGGHDQFLTHGITCLPEAGFSIEKLQALGRKGQLTSAVQFGTRREIVRYEIVITNTGNVALTLGPLQDVRCDPGTVTGGPEGPLGVGETASYTCTHQLTPADQAFGLYENVATVTAKPPPGDGPPITEESNSVLVQLPHDTVGFGCETIVFDYSDFPNAPGNTVTEWVSVDHQTVIVKSFVFDGPSGSDTVTLDLPPGKHKLDGRAHWKTNGAHGAHDQSFGGHLVCPPAEEVLR